MSTSLRAPARCVPACHRCRSQRAHTIDDGDPASLLRMNGRGKWITYRDVQLWKVANRKVYLYVVDETTVDADRAHAYHPDDTGIDARTRGSLVAG